MKNVINDLYDYELKIVQNTDNFKFSLDSILLAEFVTISGVKKIVDFCSGNAAIPLILSTKTNAIIYGVEYQKDIYDMAVESVKINKLENQIKLINDDVNNLDSYQQLSDVDAVICNPPYFKCVGSSLLNKNEVKSIARHELLINLEQVIFQASKILKNKKSFYLVHRCSRLDEIIILCNKYKLNVKNICFVQTKSDKEPELVLVKAVKDSNFGVKITSINVSNLTTYKDIFRM